MLWLGVIFTTPLIMSRALADERESLQARLREKMHQALSPIVRMALAVLAVTGALRTHHHLENGWGDLLHTSWGHLLVAKVLIVSLMVVTGAFVSYRLIPQLKSRIGQHRSPVPIPAVFARLDRLNVATIVLGLTLLAIVTLL